MRILAFFVLGLLLAACVPQEGGPPRLHDIALYNYPAAGSSRGAAANTLYGYFYGDPTTLQSGQDMLVLTKGDAQGPFVVDNALLVNGQPFLKQAIAPLDRRHFDIARVPFSTDLILRTDLPFEEVVYYDGEEWHTVGEDVEAGVSERVVPTMRPEGLRGLGDLTSAEARMLEGVFEAAGNPLAVAVLEQPRLPARQVTGLTEYLRTALVVQARIQTNEAAFTPPRQELTWDVLGKGANAAVGEGAQFELATSQGELTRLWNLAYGNQLSVPPVPQLNWDRESVAAFFLGTKPTGGYGIEVQDVTEEGGDIFIDVIVRQPAAGAITTQALTSPWVMVRVPRGNVAVAWFRSPAGELIGVAREGE